MAEKFKRFRPSEPPDIKNNPPQEPPRTTQRDDEPTGRIRTSRPAPSKSCEMEVVIPPDTKKSKL